MLHMRRILLTAALIAVTSPLLAADVAMSVSIGEPGFYGRIDIGDYPQPRVIYRQPVIVERVVVERPPIYMRVPPGHARNWRKHCREYGACGERVLFVQDTWYSREYVPRYRERQYDRRREIRDEHRNDDRDRSVGANGRKKNGDNNGRNR
jgi:hypothetical protein